MLINKTLIRCLLVAVAILGGGNCAWGDTVIKTIDFSASEWSSVRFSQENTTTPDVHNGVTFYAKSSSLHFSLKDGVLTFPDYNLSSGNFVLGFPISGIVGNTIIIKVYNGETNVRVKYKVVDGETLFSTSSVSSSVQDGYLGTPCRIIQNGLSDKAFVYIGRYNNDTNNKTITKIEVITPDLTELTKDSFSSFYASSSSTASNLIDNASLPTYVQTNFYTATSGSNNTSTITTPYDFSSIVKSTTYYRILTYPTDKIVIGGLSHVKSIRLYGNGSYNDGTINFEAVKLSGDGSTISIPSVNFISSKTTIDEYSTGDLSELEGYDRDTYYLYTITFIKNTSSSYNFSLWGLYIEYKEPDSFTISYDANGGMGTIDASTGSSITLSDGTGFTAPSGYSFAGWNTDAHGIGTSYTSGQENVKADLTLYAVWTQSGTIDGNGGSGGAYTATYNKASIEVTTAPEYSGYAVKGYYGAGTGDDILATSAGALQASTSYTDVSGYWTNSGTAPKLYAQWENTHELTVAVNDEDMGSAEADETTIAEGETTTVTATANSGYKFRSWAVSGTGAVLSSTTENPTTLTMGTADATVTATFSALYHYTITYAKGANGTGDAIANGDKTEDADFTLSSSTYTYASHLQTGWALTDGGEKAYDLGGTYTANADLTLYPYWIEQYTLTYNANGGEGSMSAEEGTGSITLTANAFTRSGYTFIGWATSESDADSRIVTYSNKGAYTLSADATLFAVWGENFCELTPTTSGTAPSSGDVITTQSGAFGGTMSALSSDLSYTTNGLLFTSSSSTKVKVILNDYLKEGSVITVKLKSPTGGVRGLYLYPADGSGKSAVADFSFTSTSQTFDEGFFQYTVTATDNLVDTNGFQLWRRNNIYLQSLTVTDCQPGGVISESGWNTYSSNKTLDLSTISGGTAYIAAEVDGSANSVRMKKCSNIVSAGTGLMVKGTAGDTFTIDAATGSEATLSETNLMVGLPNGGTVTAAANNYVFGWPTDTPTNYGFYYVNSSAATLGAGKAYLSASVSSNTRLSISFNDDVTTGIEDVESLKAENQKSCYSLQGQKVSVPRKGIYIVNGKKVVSNR